MLHRDELRKGKESEVKHTLLVQCLYQNNVMLPLNHKRTISFLAPIFYVAKKCN